MTVLDAKMIDGVFSQDSFDRPLLQNSLGDFTPGRKDELGLFSIQLYAHSIFLLI